MEGRVLPVGVHLDHSQVRDGGEYILQFTGLLSFHHNVSQHEIVLDFLIYSSASQHTRIIHTPGHIFDIIILINLTVTLL